MTLTGGTRVWLHVWAKASAAFTMNAQWQLVSKRTQRRGKLVSGRTHSCLGRRGRSQCVCDMAALGEW